MLSLQKHINHFIVKRSAAVLSGEFMGLVNKQVVYLYVWLADKQIQ